ncbi:MAG: PAS domain-containing protein [Phycisphaerales bacterium]|nr:PAS domain-containing protein [Phycisphaerales bacterium]
MSNPGHIGRRLRQRWDALLASAGMGIGVALCASSVVSVGSIWWRNADVAHQQASARAWQDVMAMKFAAQSALTGDDLIAARQSLIQAAESLKLTQWKLSLPDGRIIASSQGTQGAIEELPESWGVAPNRPADASAGREAMVIASIPDRGDVMVTVTASPQSAALWDDPTVWIVGGAGMMLGLGWLAWCRRAGTRIAGVVMVCDALRAESRGETAAEALRIDEGFGAEAVTWNAIIAERETARRREVEERAAKVLAASSTGDGPNALGGLCDAMWTGLLIFDTEGRVTYCNGAAATMLNGKREDMPGRQANEVLADEPIVNLLGKAIGGGCRHRVLHEKIVETPGAGRSTLKYSVKSLRKDDTGAAFIVIEDVTQQKVAEESRHSFAAQVTHELRTPLTNMRLYVETLVDDETNDPQVRAKCLNVLSTEVRRLERVVSDMLSVSEMEAGSIMLRNDDVRMDALLEEIEADHKATAADKEITLHFDLPPKLPVLDGDRDKIAMALHNLLGNAIKYTPAGGDVRVIVTEENAQLVIMVKDNGIGIKTEEAELIFEKFYRAKDKRITGITGSGLGLAIARQVVRLHGGDIAVSSQVDKGSTFTLTLPVGKSGTGAAPSRAAA